MVHLDWELSESLATSLFRSEKHEEALARLHYLVEQQHRVGLVLGEPGSGKSLLLSVFAASCRRERATVVRQNLTAVDGDEFPGLLASGLGITATAEHGNSRIWRAVADRLVENCYQKRPTVVLLDDAGIASDEVLQQVIRLIHLDGSRPVPLTVVLAAEPRRLQQIPELLRDRAGLRIELQPWEAAETGDFIAAYVAEAAECSAVFSQEAVRRVQELTQGVPARVQRLVDLALLAASVDGVDAIDVDTVDAVCDQLTLGAAKA
jgi:type II secretory pathway predicted ATPase ExeA